MQHKKNEYFDLPGLLQQGDADLLQAVKANPSLSVGGYFAMLSEFINLAPEVISALEKFAKLDADNRQWIKVEGMIALLTNLGCTACIPDFYAISHARGGGDWRLAAFHAKKLLDEYNGLYLRILETRRTNVPHDEHSPDDPAPAHEHHAVPDAATSLKEYIERLGNEEADRRAVGDALGILAAVSEETRRKAAAEPPRSRIG